MIKRCSGCSKILLFQKKYYVEDKTLCDNCYVAYEKSEAEAKEKRVEAGKQRRAERKKARRAEAEKRIAAELKELDSERKKSGVHEAEERAEAKVEVEPVKKRPVSKKIEPLVSFDEIKTNESVLLVECDVKRVRATEWIKGKKRIALNKEREIRHTHKGGWSQEKFQRFVDAKKRKTFEWIVDVLERPGVLKPEYELVRVVCKDGELKGGLEKYFDGRDNARNL